MAIEVQILAQNLGGESKKGNIIYEKNSPAIWGKKEKLPNYIIVTVTGAVTVLQARQYRNPWACLYDWTVDNYNSALDGYRVTIFADKVSQSGKGAITRAKLDTHLNLMGFSHHATAPNQITYDFSIYNVVTSRWFWGRDVSSVVFQENSYVPATGIHTIQADYGIASWPMDKVSEKVQNCGGVVLNNIASVITFTIEKSVIISALKDYFRAHIDEVIEERQFYVDNTYVDTVVASGGLDTKTVSEFLALIQNRLDD